MSKNLDVMILNLPSPPNIDVERNWAGGFGTAKRVARAKYGHTNKPPFHPFLAYASAVLSNENYSYSILDSQRLKLNEFQVLRYIKMRNPNVIFSLVNLPSLKKDVELLDLIKESLPNTIIVGVGTTCRFLTNDILLNSKIDVVLRNSFPYVSNLKYFLKGLELKQNLKKVLGVSYVKNEKVINTVEPLDIGLNEIRPPRYEDLELMGYSHFIDLDGYRYNYIPILGSKGCPYSCFYCPYPLGFGNKFMHRSPKEIVDEIEYLQTRGINGFLFRDQSFPMNKKYAVKVCEEMINRKLDIAWLCEARVDHVSKNLLEIMKKAGCKRIHYGVETGDPKLIKQVKQVDLNVIKKSFRLTKEIGLWVNAHIILGWPNDNLSTLKRTSKFITELDPDGVNWNVLTPYPGTKLYKIAKEKKLILTNDWSKYTSNNIVMRTKWLNDIQLKKNINKIIKYYSTQTMLKNFKRPRYVIMKFIKRAKR